MVRAPGEAVGAARAVTSRCSGTLIPVRTDLAQQWADRINRHVGAAAEAYIKVGLGLIDAKAALPHGGWERLFQGHSDAVERPVPFTHATATRLMKIAAHPELGKVAHGPLLPLSWRTAYELTKVPGPELRRALSDGRIHPAMERREVSALCPRASGPAITRAQPAGVKTAGDVCFFDIDARIRRVFFTLTTEDRVDLIAALRQAIDRLEDEINA